MVGGYLLALISSAKFVPIAINLSSAIIVYYCLSNIWALFEPQIRKVLIINNFNILHRQVENGIFKQIVLIVRSICFGSIATTATIEGSIYL